MRARAWCRGRVGCRTDVEPREVLGDPRFALLEVSRRVVFFDARDGEAPQDDHRHQARDPVEPDLRRRTTGQGWVRRDSGVRAARGGRLAAGGRTSGKVSVHLRATAYVCSATLLGSAGSGAPPR